MVTVKGKGEKSELERKGRERKISGEYEINVGCKGEDGRARREKISEYRD